MDTPAKKQWAKHKDKETGIVTLRKTILRKGKKITTTVKIEPRRVEWKDIIKACEVEPDTDHRAAPWEDCDGWEHEVIENYEDLNHEKKTPVYGSKAVEVGYGLSVLKPVITGYTYETVDHYNPDHLVHRDRGRRVLIVVTRDQAKGWGVYARKYPGQSKQLAFEAGERIRRQAIEQLCKWYSDGWEYWQVVCDFKGASAATCGIDDFEYAVRDVIPEIAAEVAHDLEKRGYKVVNGPKPLTNSQHALNRYKERICRIYGFEKYSLYREYLKKPLRFCCREDGRVMVTIDGVVPATVVPQEAST